MNRDFHDVNSGEGIPVYTAAQTRELDRVAIEECGIPGIILMKRAGRGLLELIEEKWPDISITIFCGSGNNAGDGFILAGLAVNANRSVQVVQAGSPENLRPDAATARQYAIDAGVEILNYSPGMELRPGLWVDALLGTGLSGDVKESYRQVIQTINAGSNPVLSADIPSGLNSDTGAIMGLSVNATATLTFIGVKRGLLTGGGPQACGQLYINYLELPENLPDKANISVESWCQSREVLKKLLPSRERTAHKGHFGHVLIVGGDDGMGGAALLAGEAALRAGAGLVSVATRQQHISAILAKRPELMARSVESTTEFKELLNRATVVVLGPGLGKSDWSRQMFKLSMAAEMPTVIDADGLNLLAELNSSEANTDCESSPNWILTPHPGEASRLTNLTTAEIAADRFSCVEHITSHYNCVTLLKGAGTLIAKSPAETQSLVTVNPYGNPGMATGGMGDVLSGVIGALLAQGLSAYQAACCGVLIHSLAGDQAVRVDGEKGLAASDLFRHIRRIINHAGN